MGIFYKPEKKKKGGFYKSIAGGTGNNLDNSLGLYSLAKQSGLQKEADRIVQGQKGETEQIFSGGVITDLFDTLNALQYGTVGMVKGKGFLEGVKTRESFTKSEAFKNKGLLGTIGGIAADIAFDPLTYIAPLTIIKKVPGAVVLGKAVKTKVFGQLVEKTIEGKTIKVLEGGTDAGKWLADKFVYSFGQDPSWAKQHQRSIKNIAVGESNIKKVAKPFENIDAATQRTIANARKAGKTDQLPEAIKLKVKPLFDEMDRLSKEAIDKLPLTPALKESYKKNIGSYMRRAFRTYEVPKKGIGAIFGRKPLRIDPNLMKMRKDLPEEVLEALGEIKEAGYPTVKSMLQLNRSIENAKLFNLTAEKFAVNEAQEGFKQLPKVNTLSNLAGKYVPENIYNEINAMTRPRGGFEKVMNQITGTFKYAKVILNPAAYARNSVSNKLLNYFDPEGLPLWRIDKHGAGIKSVLTKDKWFKEVEQLGGNLNTFKNSELQSLLNLPEFQGGLGKFQKYGRNLVDSFGQLYQNTELADKMSMYIYQRTTKKLGNEAAWDIAERATFNYSQITPFVRKLRESMFFFPFITFTVKATPIIGRTILEAPTKISNIGKIRNGIEQLADIKGTARERASEPEWVKNGFYVKLPIKDKQGRSAYFDLTYILPFGDLINLGEETNLKLFEKSPAFNFIKEVSSNKDFYGNKVFRESDTSENQMKDIFRHLTRLFMPPPIADQIEGGYEEKTGKRRPAVIPRALEASPENQRRNLMQEMLRQVGVKIQPLNADVQENYMEWNTKRDLDTLLRERGILKKFETSYIPK